MSITVGLQPLCNLRLVVVAEKRYPQRIVLVMIADCSLTGQVTATSSVNGQIKKQAEILSI
jgi:hypothetical protein